MVAVVLLGAGASFGSGDVAPRPPPLGNKLFDELERVGGIAASLPEALKSVFRKNFETGMTEYYAHCNGNIMRFQRELAHYLAQFCPGPSNVYEQLIGKLGVRRIIYCTLNYDLLFELSAARLGLSTTYNMEFIANHARLLKPHGSCNFWPVLPVGTFRNCTFVGSGRADIEANVGPLNQRQTIQRCLLEDSVAPAMAMYAEGKRVKVCPDYVDKQQAMWMEVVAKAKRAFVVGVRLNPADTHIWGELEKSSASVTYFGVDDYSRQSFAEWKSSTGKRNAFFVQCNFMECVSVIQSRIGK